MTIEEAIKTAIEYETRIRDIYEEAAAAVDEAPGKRIFEMLGKDEQYHLDYLNDTLEQLKKTGKVIPQRLDSIVPPRDKIEPEAERLTAMVKKDYHGVRQQMLSRALKVEIETSAFYKQMVGELPEEGRDLFSRFLEIEDNHINAVQFELDYVSNTGYWFDFKEFDME